MGLRRHSPPTTFAGIRLQPAGAPAGYKACGPRPEEFRSQNRRTDVQQLQGHDRVGRRHRAWESTVLERQPSVGEGRGSPRRRAGPARPAARCLAAASGSASSGASRLWNSLCVPWLPHEQPAAGPRDRHAGSWPGRDHDVALLGDILGLGFVRWLGRRADEKLTQGGNQPWAHGRQVVDPTGCLDPVAGDGPPRANGLGCPIATLWENAEPIPRRPPESHLGRWIR